MSAILLKPAPELDSSAPAVMPRDGGSTRELAVAAGRPRFSRVPVGFALHGFTHLRSTSNHKEWRFFGDQRSLDRDRF